MSAISQFLDLFKKKDDSVIGIDIGSSAIKVVQLRKKKGKAILETYGELSLGPYANTEIGRATNLSSDVIGKALLALLKEAKVNTTRAGIAIPLSASLISFIKMPALDSKQLTQMIPIEARKYIPVPISEVTLDWSVVPVATDQFEEDPNQKKEDGKKEVEVLVVVIHNEALNKYRTMSTTVALDTTFFEIELFSTIRAALDNGIATNMVMDMGAGTTKLYIVERGVLKNSHTINRGSQDITLALSKALSVSVDEAEHLKRTVGLSPKPEDKQINEIITLTLDYIFYEANRVLLNYQKKYNKDIAKVTLAGGGVLLNGFAELAKESFQSEVMRADPFAKIETPAFLDDVLKTAGPEFAVAVGVALRKLQEVE